MYKNLMHISFFAKIEDRIPFNARLLKITHEQSVGLELEDRSWNGIIGELILYRKDIL